MNIVLLLLFGRLGHQGNTENLCNFAKLFSFWGYFFSYFHGQNKYKITLYVHFRVRTKKEIFWGKNRLITCSWRQKLNSSIHEFMNSRFLILKTFINVHIYYYVLGVYNFDSALRNSKGLLSPKFFPKKYILSKPRSKRGVFYNQFLRLSIKTERSWQ